jgi:hypothetical protein
MGFLRPNKRIRIFWEIFWEIFFIVNKKNRILKKPELNGVGIHARLQFYY